MRSGEVESLRLSFQVGGAAVPAARFAGLCDGDAAASAAEGAPTAQDWRLGHPIAPVGGQRTILLMRCVGAGGVEAGRRVADARGFGDQQQRRTVGLDCGNGGVVGRAGVAQARRLVVVDERRVVEAIRGFVMRAPDAA